MKKLLSYSFLLLFAGASLTGCQQDPNSTGSPSAERPLAPGGHNTSPHTALVWLGAQIIGSNTYSAIFVADTDLSHEARVQVAASPWTAVHYGAVPNWSPTGGSVVFGQYGSATLPDTIKAFDISSSGAVSNLRKIVGLPNQSARLHAPIWSSTTTMGKIAYTTTEGATNSLWVVSQSGGTPTQICSVDTSWVGYGFPFGGVPTWSPDDSRLAVSRLGSGGTSTTIMIFNTTTSPWSYVDSITVSGSIFGLEWSRTGTMNKLCYGLQASGSTHQYLYYCTPTTGATPTTNGVEGGYPTWAPNNSLVMFENKYLNWLQKNVPLTATTTSVSNFGGTGMKWKR